MKKSRFSISARILGMALILLIGMGLMQWINYWACSQIQNKVVQPEVNRIVMEGKKQLIKNLVMTHVKVLGEKFKTITDPGERMKLVCEQTDTARFFDDGSGYLFVYDVNANCINAPNNKSRNGKNFSYESDPSGKRIIDELDKAALAGGDFVDYVYPKPSGGTASKISYAMMISGTDWFLGCGAYADDVRREQDALQAKVNALGEKYFRINILLFIVLFALLIFLAIWITRRISRAIRHAIILGRENTCLQLIIRLIGNIKVAAGLDNLVNTLLHSVHEVIGGKNIVLYYQIGDDLRRADIYGAQEKIDKIDDPFIRGIFTRRSPHKLASDHNNPSNQPSQHVWGFPLLDGHELVGAIKIENPRNVEVGLFEQLHVFFTYVASVLKNETAGQIRLMSHREAVASMEHVLAIVGHELRTPLAGLRAISELLMNPSMLQDESSGKFLNTMNKEIVRMSGMVNDLLEAARLNSGHVRWNWETVALKDVCQEAIDSVTLLNDEHAVALSCHVEPENLAMQGDVGAISRLLINLLSNSVKFTTRGEITINAQADPDSQGWLILRIRDTGQGIPQRILDKLGQPFALNSGMAGSAHAHGTGLGISICIRIAAAHGGTLSVESEEGVGTTLTARLRADLPEPEPIPTHVNLIKGS